LTLRTLPLPCTIADHLALAERAVAPDLVSPAAWERLRAIADPLPPMAIDAALEIRLEQGDPRVDFALCLQSGGRSRRRLADAIAGSAAAVRSRGWRRALGFVRAWANAESPIHANVRALWLEFDAADSGSPEPFLVFTVDGERLYPDGRAATDELVKTVAAGIRTAECVDDDTAGAVERCVRALPRYAQLRHAAVRPTPDGDVARLVVRMPWRRTAGALSELGWRGNASELSQTLERLCPDTAIHAVNLDVLANGIGPRVGIEFVHPGAPCESPQWQALFDALESLGACAAERRAAVDAWGGEALGSALGPGVLCVRRDLMVKVIHEAGKPVRAKAYLTFAPRLALEASG
jgi:hypothetical protein